MAVSYALPDRLVSMETFSRQADIHNFADLLATGKDDESLTLPEGDLRLKDIRAAKTPEGEPFKPIGVGKPLSIRIHTVYVGDIPRKRRRDILVVSGLKAIQTLDAQPRMINLLAKDIDDFTHPGFSPFSSGTRLIYYTQALVDHDITTQIEVVADDFDPRAFDTISNMFQMAGGLPIFAPASAFLFAGSVLVRMVGKLLDTFKERGPFLVDTQRLTFGVAALPAFAAGIYVMSNGNPARLFPAHKVRLVNRELRLVSPAGDVYTGSDPYVIIGIDGRDEPQLEGFQGQVAQASLLDKYFPQEERHTVVLEEVEKALELLNDFRFRRDAERLSAKLENLEPDDPNREKLQALLEAYKKNIVTDLFKLKEA